MLLASPNVTVTRKRYRTKIKLILQLLAQYLYWWLVQSHHSGFFWLFAAKFWEVAEAYEWYFVIL